MRKLYLSLLVFTLVFIAYGAVRQVIKNSIDKKVSVTVEESGPFLKNTRVLEVQESGDYLAGVFAARQKKFKGSATTTVSTTTINMAIPAVSLSESFDGAGSVEEAGSITETNNPYWWVNSGGRLIQSMSTGKTAQGDMSVDDRWYGAYAAANPTDTDIGLHPQNIFRLVQINKWTNFTQQAYFKINALNKSASPNRNASNGIMLFNRYQSGDNLYYTGLRVDGAAVIKKKMNGTYYTLAYKPYFSGAVYDRSTNPNLLPLNSWIGIKSRVVNNADGSVTVGLYIDRDKTGVWTLVLEAVDRGSAYGPSPITGPGYLGIRTDFMDVEFDDYLTNAI